MIFESKERNKDRAILYHLHQILCHNHFILHEATLYICIPPTLNQFVLFHDHQNCDSMYNIVNH